MKLAQGNGSSWDRPPQQETMETVVVVDQDSAEQVSYARTLTSDDRIYTFHTLQGLHRDGEATASLYGDQWLEQVTSRLDRDALREHWMPPIEIIILAQNPAVEFVTPHFQRVGFLSRPFRDMTTEEVQEWLTQRVSTLPRA